MDINSEHFQIETKRLTIRRFRPDDSGDLYEYLSNEETVRYEPYGVFNREECEGEAVIRSENPSFRAVCMRETGKLIGNLYFAPREYGTSELGYVFNPGFHGMGYAYESASALIGYMFGSRAARRVAAFVNPLNVPSWRLLERLGFRREGHLIKNIYFKKDPDGSPIWNDTYEYACLAEEWRRGEALP